MASARRRKQEIGRKNKKSSSSRHKLESENQLVDQKEHKATSYMISLASLLAVVVMACSWAFRDILMAKTNQTLFLHIEDGLSGEPNISFDPSKLRYAKDVAGIPQTLAPPVYVRVYKYQHKTRCNLATLGAAARQIVDQQLSTTGAILFRNLHQCIRTTQDFKTFWEGCISSSSSGDWKPMEYFPAGRKRPQIDGVDTPTNFSPRAVVECHNEMTYNPKPAGKIGFYCLQDAETGGETLLKKNEDMTQIVSKETLEFIRQHGGILSEREMHDAQNKPADVEPARHGSWQEQCGVETVEEAVKVFTDLGWSRDSISIDQETTIMTVKHIGSGFIDNDNADEPVWFSNVDMGNARCADGTYIPRNLQLQYNRDKWSVTTAIKLQPGDWLVLDNKAVQHGRLPYQDSRHKKRILLDVYTE